MPFQTPVLVGRPASASLRSAAPAKPASSSIIPASAATSSPAPRKTAPVAKRPKGQTLLTLVLLSLIGGIGYQVWDAFFRYKAHGQILGNVLQISSPWEATVDVWHVREGETVRPGQVLVSVQNLEHKQRRAQIEDDIRLTQANLDAEMAKLRWQVMFHFDGSSGNQSRALESAANLRFEKILLEKLEVEASRAQSLARSLPQHEVDKATYDVRAQKEKVRLLETAAKEHKKREEPSKELLKQITDGQKRLDDFDQVRPFLVKIRILESDLKRLEEKVELGRVRAPTAGVVVRRMRFPGECCKANEPLVSILEEGSLRVVVYLPQERLAEDNAGVSHSVRCEPHREPIVCRFERFADEFTTPPEAFRRFYKAGQSVLPMYLRPEGHLPSWSPLRVGSQVQLQ